MASFIRFPLGDFLVERPERVKEFLLKYHLYKTSGKDNEYDLLLLNKIRSALYKEQGGANPQGSKDYHKGNIRLLFFEFDVKSFYDKNYKFAHESNIYRCLFFLDMYIEDDH